MANEQNLKRGGITADIASSMGRKGGIASGESKRRKRTLKEGLELLLTLPVTDTRNKSKLAKMGVPAELLDNEQLMNLALLKKAQTGDVKAYEAIRSTIGEDAFTPPTGEQADNLLAALTAQVDVVFKGPNQAKKDTDSDGDSK